MAEPNRNSCSDDTDKVLYDEEFCREIDVLSKERCKYRNTGIDLRLNISFFCLSFVTGDVTPTSPSFSTPGPLNTAFLDVKDFIFREIYENKNFLCTTRNLV